MIFCVFLRDFTSFEYMKNKFLTVILIASSIFLVGNNHVLAAESEVNGRWAVVALSSIYMRALPDYESALETQELMGRVVKIVDESSYWRKIESDQPYTAWCTEKGLVEMDDAQLKEYSNAAKLIVTALYSHIYSSPSEQSLPVTDLVCGDILRYADVSNVKDSHGGGVEMYVNYVSVGSPKASDKSRKEDGKSYKTVKQRYRAVNQRGKHSREWLNVLLPTGDAGWVKKSDVADLDKWVMAADDCADNIIATAKQFVGVPYLWGGMSSKGFDCSGLVRVVYMMNGVLLPRNASQQIYCGKKIDVCEEHEDFAENIEETVKNLRAGDLLFFGYHKGGEIGDRVTHVGIYIGDGKMIHSSHLVRINSLSPGAPDYYENSWKLIGACRVIGNENEGSHGFRPRKF